MDDDGSFWHWLVLVMFFFVWFWVGVYWVLTF
jgi:hypothetical protein